MTNYMFNDVCERDLVELKIRNNVNVQDKMVALFSEAVTSYYLMWSGVSWGRSFSQMRGSA